MPVILDLCGGSGAWSAPYAKAGYEVILIDPFASSGDVRLTALPTQKVHGILAAPPCTIFARSGARWWPTKGTTALIDGLSVVDACLRLVLMCEPVWWCLENPIGRLRTYLGPPKCYFQPWEFGDPYTKKTALWGNFNLPKKAPVEPTEGNKLSNLPEGPNRARLRSITPAGFARAFFEANP
jgi:hypothetical protein